jgi:hypothetical protein
VTLSDPDVIQLLSTEVIPVWESVGSVPKVTIELGNGKTLERTLGGNIVTYILSSEGDVYDAYPGVYRPWDYISEIQKTLNFVNNLKQPENAKEIVSWHRAQFSEQVQFEQQRITFSKALVESPLLKALNMGPAIGTEKNTNFRDISKEPATVQELSNMLLKTKSKDPEEIGRSGVDADSENNLKLMRPAVHALYSNYNSLPKIEKFRDVIYKELLHIPLDDPYLGLAGALVPGSPAGQ